MEIRRPFLYHSHHRNTITVHSGLSLFLFSWTPIRTINYRPYSTASTICCVDSITWFCVSWKILKDKIIPIINHFWKKFKIIPKHIQIYYTYQLHPKVLESCCGKSQSCTELLMKEIFCKTIYFWLQKCWGKILSPISIVSVMSVFPELRKSTVPRLLHHPVNNSPIWSNCLRLYTFH